MMRQVLTCLCVLFLTATVFQAQEGGPVAVPVEPVQYFPVATDQILTERCGDAALMMTILKDHNSGRSLYRVKDGALERVTFDNDKSVGARDLEFLSTGNPCYFVARFPQTPKKFQLMIVKDALAKKIEELEFADVKGVSASRVGDGIVVNTSTKSPNGNTYKAWHVTWDSVKPVTTADGKQYENTVALGVIEAPDGKCYADDFLATKPTLTLFENGALRPLGEVPVPAGIRVSEGSIKVMIGPDGPVVWATDGKDYSTPRIWAITDKGAEWILSPLGTPLRGFYFFVVQDDNGVLVARLDRDRAYRHHLYTVYRVSGTSARTLTIDDEHIGGSLSVEMVSWAAGRMLLHRSTSGNQEELWCVDGDRVCALRTPDGKPLAGRPKDWHFHFDNLGVFIGNAAGLRWMLDGATAIPLKGPEPLALVHNQAVHYSAGNLRLVSWEPKGKRGRAAIGVISEEGTVTPLRASDGYDLQGQRLNIADTPTGILITTPETGETSKPKVYWLKPEN